VRDQKGAGPIEPPGSQPIFAVGQFQVGCTRVDGPQDDHYEDRKPDGNAQHDDGRSGRDRIAKTSALRQTNDRPSRDEHEEKGEKIGVADVLRGLDMERIQGEEQRCCEPRAGPKKCCAELKRERDGCDADQQQRGQRIDGQHADDDLMGRGDRRQSGEDREGHRRRQERHRDGNGTEHA